MIRLVRLGLALSILLASQLALAEDPSGSDSLDRLTGKWKLDWDRSESFAPAMKALEVPWLVRQMAGLVSVQVTIDVEPPDCQACRPSLHISSENPIKNTSRYVHLDGVSRPFTDVMGNESMDLFTWSADDGMEMIRERVLDSGKLAKIYERRSVNDDLTTMVSTMIVWVDGEERASVRRVLLRVER